MIVKKDAVSEKDKRQIIQQVIRPVIPQKQERRLIGTTSIPPEKGLSSAARTATAGQTSRVIIIPTAALTAALRRQVRSADKDPSKVEVAPATWAAISPRISSPPDYATQPPEVQLAYAIGVANPVSVSL